MATCMWRIGFRLQPQLAPQHSCEAPTGTALHTASTHHDRPVAHIELGLSRDHGLLVLLYNRGDPAKGIQVLGAGKARRERARPAGEGLGPGCPSLMCHHPAASGPHPACPWAWPCQGQECTSGTLWTNGVQAGPRDRTQPCPLVSLSGALADPRNHCGPSCSIPSARGLHRLPPALHVHPPPAQAGLPPGRLWGLCVSCWLASLHTPCGRLQAGSQACPMSLQVLWPNVPGKTVYMPWCVCSGQFQRPALSPGALWAGRWCRVFLPRTVSPSDPGHKGLQASGAAGGRVGAGGGLLPTAAAHPKW